MYISITAIPDAEVLAMSDAEWLTYLRDSLAYCESENRAKRFTNSEWHSHRVLALTLARVEATVTA